MSAEPPWHILGAGALGCLIATRMLLAGAAPTLILRNDEALAEARATGITLDPALPDAPPHHPPPVPDRSGAIRIDTLALQTAARLDTPLERVLLCTKAPQSVEALASVSAWLTPSTHVILLQNGMGVSEQLCARWPDLTVLHGITTEGAWRKQRFHIVHAARGETLLGGSGALAPMTRAVLESLARTLSDAGLSTRVTADCRPALWEKLTVNSVLNPLTALHRCRNGETASIPGVAATIHALCNEAAAVAQACGVTVTAAALEARVLQIRAATALNRSSMLQDVLARRATEIDFINGYIVREAARHRIAVPVQEAMWRAVTALPLRG